MSSHPPSISVVMPTLNAARVLRESLSSIAAQDYPNDLVEIIIADAGSTDKTVDIAKEYGAKVVANPLKTGEAGKSEAVKAAKNEIIALIDSDNILPNKDWLKKMVEPFADPSIIGAEPIRYTWRRKDGFITRYSALTGVNDPLCIFLGNYDRMSLLTNKWTGLPVEVWDKQNYLKIKLDRVIFPTMGANGFMVRRQSLAKHFGGGDYLFDIDIIYDLVKDDDARFAKVKVGIVHLYSQNTATFFRKQLRRIRDYRYYSGKQLRTYPWNSLSKLGFIKFIVYCVTVLPLFAQAFIGFLRFPDFRAWIFHPLACEITFFTYAYGTIESFFKSTEQSRENWKQ